MINQASGEQRLRSWSNLPRYMVNDPLLVGGIPTPLKNMKVSWDYYSQYMEKKKNVPNHQPDCKIGFQEGAVRGSPMGPSVRWRVASFPRPFSEFTMFYLWKVVFFPQRKKRISRWPLFRGRRACATAILMKHVMIRKQIHRGIAFLSNATARPVWLTCDCFGTTEGTFCETLDLMM